jgi:very-short-patch-repair endonuclease
LEIDGKQHNFRKEHDIKRDSYLSNNNNIIIYRIKWKSINNDKGKKYIENEIKNFLDFYNSK